MFLTYGLFASAFNKPLEELMIGWLGDNEYEPDVTENSVEVGEKDCVSNELRWDDNFEIFEKDFECERFRAKREQSEGYEVVRWAL